MIKSDLYFLIDDIEWNLEKYRENGFLPIMGVDPQILTEGYELYEYTICKTALSIARNMLNDVGRDEIINQNTPDVTNPEEFLMNEVLAGVSNSIDEQSYRLDIVEILKVDEGCLFRKSRQDDAYQRRQNIIDTAFARSFERSTPIADIENLEQTGSTGGALAIFLNRDPSP